MIYGFPAYQVIGVSFIIIGVLLIIVGTVRHRFVFRRPVDDFARAMPDQGARNVRARNEARPESVLDEPLVFGGAFLLAIGLTIIAAPSIDFIRG